MSHNGVSTAATALLAVTLCSCSSASTQSTIDYQDNYRFAGSLSGVRVNAQLIGDTGRLPLSVVYEIENGRDHEIAVVTGVAHASYSEPDRTLVLNVGAEIPESENMLVERIRPGEKRSFTSTAALGSAPNPRLRQAARFVKVKLIYLRGLAGFNVEEHETGRASIRVTDAAFPHWLEKNESLTTNALPLARAASSGSRAGAEHRYPAFRPQPRPF